MRAEAESWLQRGFIAMAGVVFALAVSATPSSAVEHPFLEQLGSAKRQDLVHPRALAVDRTTGDVLVLAGNPPTISRYAVDGTPSEFAALGTNQIDGKGGGACPAVPSDCDQTPENGFPGFGGDPKELQIAVAPPSAAGGTAGDIYVTQGRDDLIDIFSSEGEYLGQLTGFKAGPAAEGPEVKPLTEPCGVATGPGGEVYVGDFGAPDLIHKYVPTTNPPTNADNVANFASLLGTSSPCTVAAGAGLTAGSIFANRFNGELFKLDASSGTLAYKLGNGHTTVSVDPSSGHVYAPAGEEVREYDASGASPAPPVHTITSCSGVQGVAVDGGSGRVYVTRKDFPQISVYGPAIPTPPTIGEACSPDTAWTAGATVSEATLKALVNPNGLATEYQIEYGPSEAYGALSPPLSAGSGEAAKTVTYSLGGLDPATTYHWRVVASNEKGSRAGPDRTLTTLAAPEALPPCPNDPLRLGAAAFLADCRAYEMVSPLDKAGSDVKPRVLTTLAGTPVGRNQSDLEGRRFTYTTGRAFGDAVSQPLAVQYMASRGGGGWSSHGISPPREWLRGGVAAGGNNEFKVFAADLCTAWVVTDDTTASPLAPGAEEGAQNLYRRSNCDAEGYDSLDASPNEQQVLGLSADGMQTLFSSGGLLRLAGGGEATPVCLLPQKIPPASCSAGTAGSDEYQNSVSHAIAEDGRRVFWSTGSITGPIYMRENPSEPQSELEHGAATGRGGIATGSSEVSGLSTESGEFEPGQTITARAGIPFGTTVLACTPGCGTEAEALTLSAAATQNRTNFSINAYSECGEPYKACTLPVSESVDTGEFAPESTTREARFWAAAADGAEALFSFDPDREGSSFGPEGPVLYEYDAETRTPHPIAPDFLGLLGASEDLSRIYLVSEDATLDETAKGEGAQAGKPNLYLYRAGGGGSFGFIATLAGDDARGAADHKDPSPISVNPSGHSARVSPDGRSAAFTSAAPLSGYDNTDAVSGEADREVFHYDAGTDTLRCASCNPSGGRPEGRHVTGFGRDYHAAAQIPPFEHQLYASRALSENGNRLFFESFDPLVLRDNNKAEDVYEWEATGEGTCTASSPRYSPPNGGCLSLISSGENGQDSEFLDATPDGSDVFFTTGASLVGTDPGLIDIYDARVEGGFPEPPPPPAPCEGEACQSPPPAPSFSRPPSSTFEGPGDLPGPSRCTAPAKRAKRLAHRAARLRAGARAASRHGQAPRARRVARRAQRLTRRAHGLSRKAKRCRRRERRQAR